MAEKNTIELPDLEKILEFFKQQPILLLIAFVMLLVFYLVKAIITSPPASSTNPSPAPPVALTVLRYITGLAGITIVLGFGLLFYKISKETNPTPKLGTASSQPVSSTDEPKMVLIKGGTFLMGSSDSEKGRESDEKQHSVTVGNFYLGKYEVTQAQWKAVMGNNPSVFKDCGDNCPVENVSWNDVQSFIEKLNAQTGKNYRLPTEAEWEYAARAKKATPFYTGNCITTEQANYNGNHDYNNCGAKTDVYKQKPVSVGSYSANNYDLYDMAGNVWEWTCSEYVEKYNGREKECSNYSSTQRVIRGGSWENPPQYLRSANRGKHPPANRLSKLGFRLSRM